MSVSSVYALHGVVSGSMFLSQIQNARVTSDIQTMIAQSAGLPYPLFAGTMSANPGVTFETTQIQSVLNSTGILTSICDLSGVNTDLYFKNIADLGRRTPDASSAHMRFRMAQAFMTLGQITAGHNQEAVASVRIGTTYDGTNLPLVPAGAQALAGTPSSAEHFVAGPVVINGVQLPGVQDLTIDFGRQVMELGADGELFNTFAACQFYSPVVTIRCLQHVWATYGVTGSLLTALSVYLRKVTALGRDADATASHVKFTATTGIIHVDEASGGNNDPSMVTVRCTLVSASATSEAIAVSTASAIT